MGFVAVGVLSPSVRAQPAATAAAVDPKITADAARCLAIDTEIAGLAAQVRAGTLTAEGRKARADALTAERTRITASYGARNTPGYRALIAEFNRLRAEATAEAREQAAAETKAKREAAAAEALAKREAAQAEAKAKREAQAAADAAAQAERARLAAAAEDAIFADVSVVAEAQLARARDQFYVEFGLPSPTSPAQATQQTNAAQAARAKHVPPAAAELRPTFDQRVKTLVDQRLPERRAGWFAEVFPEPADIVSRISGDTEKTAALELATRLLSERTTGVRPYAAQQKLEAYQQARSPLKPDFAKVGPLSRDKRFGARVFEKTLPAYAASLLQQAKADEEMAALMEKRRLINQATNLTVLVVVVVALWLPVRLMRKTTFRWKRQSRAEWETLMADTPLPQELWWIEVPGFRYPVTVMSGRVFEKEVWTETTVTTTTTTNPGTRTAYGYTGGYTSTQTSVSSTTYHRYWLTKADGSETWQKYSDNEFLAASGHKISSLWSDNYWALMAYNHATATLVHPAWWTKRMHAPQFWRAVGITTAVGAAIGFAGHLAMLTFLGGSGSTVIENADHVAGAVGVMAVGLFIGLLVYASIVGAIITSRRQKHFRKHVVPRYEAFFRGYDPVIPETKRVTGVQA